ncbi:hypothetical protein E6C27_scaffold103G00160 [Cucumis melo var. makuwa]|uniref:Uncharacterized protein n=1 Tax=Cucumis melo var. makuwa TaxID=1194695 RepID=A0A5A7T0L3_CUCMM|nr:hypothetical protein E6C27_scaffold103G00160 [Cucumis melo var. makuwa]
MKQNKGIKVVVPFFASKRVFKRLLFFLLSFFYYSFFLFSFLFSAIIWRGDFVVSDPTSTRRRSGFCRQITVLVGAIDTFIVWRGGSAVSDPTSIGGRSDFCCQIHHPVAAIEHIRRLERSDWASSSLGEVTLSSVIQLLQGDDRTFAVKFTALIYRPGRNDQTPSSFGEVTLTSAIQLLLGDDRAFAVKSTVLVGAIGRLCRLERDGGKTVPSTSSWRSKGGAAPLSSSQGYNILEMR